MALEIVTVPCRTDNYAYLLRDGDGAGSRVAVIDAPEAGPIEAALAARDWKLNMILITHHHDDHISGVDRLRGISGATVVGAAADRHRLPSLDIAVEDGDTIALGASKAEVIDVPGHTVGHIAYYFADAGALFSADSLMVMGCGRLLEGTPAMMQASLSRLAALPGATAVYSGHEYAESNLRFALALSSGDAALNARAAEIAALRAEGRPTVPSTIAVERASNPFLRVADPSFKGQLGLAEFSDIEAFAEVRRRKDVF